VTHGRRRILRALAGLLVAGALTGAGTAGHGAFSGRPTSRAANPPIGPSRTSAASLLDEGARARAEEDQGQFTEAAKRLRAVRAKVRPDADLELALALDEARSGQLDSAWTRLGSKLLTAALADTAPATRWHETPPAREKLWFNGAFDGWHWYVARARAEVALELGRWSDAERAARAAVRALPLSGRDHLLLAVAAGRAGDDSTASAESGLAALLDPLLPEAQYLAGVWAWRAGERTLAREAFQQAIAADSAYRPPALALVRLQLPGARPDSLPEVFLTGVRNAAALCDPQLPKPDSQPQIDQLPGLYGSEPTLALPPELQGEMHLEKPLHFFVLVLVDERGRAAATNLPYLAPSSMPPPLLHLVLAQALRWRFRPALKFGRPVPSWASVETIVNP